MFNTKFKVYIRKNILIRENKWLEMIASICTGTASNFVLSVAIIRFFSSETFSKGPCNLRNTPVNLVRSS